MLLKLTLSKLAEICHGELVGVDKEVTSVVTDSRNIVQGAVFVALRGERFDGHEYARVALDSGAVGTICDHDLDIMPYIKVSDTVQAYGKIARSVRESFTGKVVCVTGSNGKTTVKDWLAQSLVGRSVLKTHANLNNQIGVPQTLLGLEVGHEVAVIETGTSFPGEIAKLSSIALPDIVILTNASGSHLEGFGSLEGIAQEKGALISGAKDNATVILNADDPFYEYWKELTGKRSVFSFGFHEGADLYAHDLSLGATSSRAVFRYLGEEYSVCIASPGKHQIANGMAIVLAMLALGMSVQESIKKLSMPIQIPGRLERMETKNKALLINDCYNASPTSVEAAIDVLTKQKVEITWLVLGALGELGDQWEKIHQSIGQYAKEKGVTHIVCLGPIAGIAGKAFEMLGGDTTYCQTHEDAAKVVDSLNEENAILVKGSRSARMEKVVNILTN